MLTAAMRPSLKSSGIQVMLHTRPVRGQVRGRSAFQVVFLDDSARLDFRFDACGTFWNESVIFHLTM